MRIIEQLNKLPINAGEYLVLPNMQTPYFIIPLHSRNIFLNAIRLIKTKNTKGWIKKYLLQRAPFFILKKIFPIITVKSRHLADETSQLILPWNQDVCNKFTIFNFSNKNISLIKIGFGKYRGMILNEYNSIINAVKYGKNVTPEILSFSETNDFTIIETTFYKGIHPNELPTSIIDFFDNIKSNSKEVKLIKHPYVSRILKEILIVLEKEGFNCLLNTVHFYSKKYENELVSIVLMHSDCSLTNVIETGGRDILIDWEECVVDGAPIDVAYFDFRMRIDNGKSWSVNNVIDFLVVLHYIFLQIKHNNISHLTKISWESTETDFSIIKI